MCFLIYSKLIMVVIKYVVIVLNVEFSILIFGIFVKV